jgi:hypothetical protein
MNPKKDKAKTPEKISFTPQANFPLMLSERLN